MPRLLLHSRDLQLRNLLGPALGPDFRLVVESDDERTKELVAQGACDVLILDLDGFPQGWMLEVFETVRNSSIPIMALASDGKRAEAIELVERGAYDWVRRPPVIPEFKAAVRRACENRAPRSKIQQIGKQQTAGCDELIGSSAAAGIVYDLIRRVCGLDASVLITGESGTGKELIARAIHRLSRRKDSPFVTVSCGAIPENLIEAELFGYEKGAFTGANSKRTGYLEHAGAGTLFLDEIGELSLFTQVKLLRVVQEREFSPLGGTDMVPLRARLVFATHRNLKQMVLDGTFRQDFYYRVNVIGIQSPPLRERSEDIPALANHFARKYAASFGAGVKRLNSVAMALLLEHSWPGNIRELENVIQRAIVLSDGEEIGPEHLPETLQPGDSGIAGASPGTSFEGQLQAFKIALARKAIHESDGNKTVAAQSLGISRTYLHRLIRDPDEPELKLA